MMQDRKIDMAKSIGKNGKTKRTGHGRSFGLSLRHQSIRDLAWSGQHTQAIAAVTKALSASDLSPADKMELLDLRAESFFALGKFGLSEIDANAMMELADPSNPELTVHAFNRKAFTLEKKGELKEAIKLATSSVEIARSTKPVNLHLLGMSLYALADALSSSSEYESAIKAAQESITCFESLGDASRAGRAYRLLAPSYNVLGNAKKSRQAAQTSLELCQQAGDALGVGNALNALSSTDPDIAERIHHYQQAIRSFESAGYLERQSAAIGNLGFTYAALGLYMHASRLTSKALDMTTSMGAKLGMSYWLENLFDDELRLGMIESARKHLDAMAELAPSFGNFRITSSVDTNKGLLALAEGKPQEAVQYFRSAVQIVQQAAIGNENVHLTYLANAHLINNDPVEALAASTRATDLHREQDYKLPDSFSSQEIWWRHAQALLANGKTAEARTALEQAYKFLLEAISNVRDEGLRRNYLNKVIENRELLQFWVEDSIKRKLPKKKIYAHLFIESNVREPFRRLTDTSLRLNALHTISDIHTFIVEEATELSGGERVLFITENDGENKVTEFILPRGEDIQEVLRDIEPYLTQTRLARTVQLILPTEANPTLGQDGEKRSRIIAPLIAQNQIIGYIYVDMDSLYGTFTEVDSDMLGMLANQAAVALDNVHWATGLEQKVQERTAELNARVDELAIINRVQAGLASQLDVNSIYKLIGEQLRVLFDSQAISITSFDLKKNTRHYQYILEKGQRLDIPDGEIAPLSQYLIRSKKPLMVNENFNERLAEIGIVSQTVPGTKPAKSLIRMPIMDGDEVCGVIGLDNIDREHAFSEADIRLLATLASSMSVALEKARLYQQAQEASAAKSVFLANMSHELRTPLHAILGFTRIVRRKSEGLLPEKQIENLDKVIASGEHLLELISSVLDIAKIEAGRMEVHPANFNINALIDQCATIAAPLFKPEVQFEKHTGGSPLIVHSDQEKIKQILVNLLSNAAKFTHEGRVILTMEKLEANEETPELLRISIEDSGIGISEESLGKIFGEFQQADSSTTRQYGGTGLGLTISRNLARLLSGNLTATSETDKGSTFTLTLPVQYQHLKSI
jgi:signal transduction histidine kinase/tetratricopeptide (TPR) repeat protein